MSDTATTSASYLTQEAYDRLKAELDHLSGAGRTEIAKKIEAAREEGDLRENGGYHAAKEEQGKQEARIRQLTQLLETATVGEAAADDGIVGPAWSSRSTSRGDEMTLPARQPRDRRGHRPRGLQREVPAGRRHHRQEGRRHRVLQGPERQAASGQDPQGQAVRRLSQTRTTKAASPAGEAAFVVSAARRLSASAAVVSGWRSGGTAGWPAARRPAARPRPRSAV